MSCQATNRDPLVAIIAWLESFIIRKLVDSCFSGDRAVSALRF